jgi:hypothetical protein
MPSTILLGLGGSSGGCRAAVETSVISIEGLIWRPRGFPRGIEEAKREMERWGEVLTKTGKRAACLFSAPYLSVYMLIAALIPYQDTVQGA